MKLSSTYIVIESQNQALIEKTINLYFSGPYLNHGAIDIELLDDREKNSTVLNFPSGIDNGIFLFFFTSLSTDQEMAKVKHTGWFTMDNELLESVRAFASKENLEMDGSLNRIMLTTEMTKDYTVGHSSTGQKIHFHYSGNVEVQQSDKYAEPQLENSEFKMIKSIQIPAKAAAFKDYSSNRLVIKITLLIVFLLFVTLYLLNRYQS
jgi:hypothetical protein